MTDLNFPFTARSSDTRRASPEPIWSVIELLFFAYRDFISEPDNVLARLGFGRAHHRVLHSIARADRGRRKG